MRLDHANLCQPLHKDEIRIFCLHPGSRGDSLTGHLKTINLQSNQGRPSSQYDALSYVWGDNLQDHEKLEINGHTIEITRNLALALSQLRLPTGERCIWVDCLCMNQHDLSERSSQVGMMLEIFSYAQKTCIHLGPETTETSFGFRALETLRVSPTSGWTAIWEDPPPLVCAGILDIMRRPWWTRTWCVQEAVVAREVVFFCGRQSLTWPNKAQDVYRFSRSLKAAVCSPQWEQFGVGIACLNPLVEILRLQLDSGPDSNAWARADSTPDLLDIAYDMRDRLSTDPRDKMFGLIGLAKSAGASAVALDRYVDYSKDNTTSFGDLALRALPRDPFDPRTTRSQEGCELQGRALTSLYLGRMARAHDSLLDTQARHEDQFSEDTHVNGLKLDDGIRIDETVRINGIYPNEPISGETTSTSHSVKSIEDKLEQAMAAVRAGNVENAAEAFIQLGQSMLNSTEASPRPCHCHCERDS